MHRERSSFTTEICKRLRQIVGLQPGLQQEVLTENSRIQEAGAIFKEDSGMAKTYTVTITMENGGVMKGELYPEIAPITVENFKKLCDEKFYDGLTFHRIIKGFMIQGGDPDGNGTGGPGYSIKGEFAENGVPNDLKHTRGVLSMARAMDPDSAGSQFFIMHQDAPHLDGQYAAFGKITEGLDVLDEIADVKTNWSDAPWEPQVIRSIEVTED